MLKARFSFALASAVLLFGCAHSKLGARRLAEETPNRCLAVRGNGELMMAHISSFAAITEHFGLFDGLAGGSSATLSMFLYESISQNPEISNCGESQRKECTPEQTALRASLLLKSVYAYIDLVKNSNEGQAALTLFQEMSQLRETLKSVNIDRLADVAHLNRAVIDEIVRQFHAVTDSPAVRSFINPRTFAIMVDGQGDSTLGLAKLTHSPSDLKIKAFRLREFYAQIQNFGNFKADSKLIFFRPSLVSFDDLAGKVGLIANFYAERGNVEDGSDFDSKGLRNFLNTCSEASRNLTWFDFISANPQCERQMLGLIQAYNQNHSNTSVVQPRFHDRIGKYLHILASSAVLSGAAETFKDNERKYLNASGAGYNFQSSDFNVFKNVKFGYFGSAGDIERLESAARTSLYKDDYKMARLAGFKDAIWEEVLNYSPAEPGLSALTLPEQLYSLPQSPWKSGGVSVIAHVDDVMAAGWSDLSPTLALRNMGCSSVLYITRREPDASFAQGLVQQLGATSSDVSTLYGLDPLQNPPSSLQTSLKAADGVWCTDWNAADLEIPKVKELDHDAYVETNMESATPAVVQGMFLNPDDSFKSRIVPHRYIGCGGSEAVLPGHSHNSGQ